MSTLLDMNYCEKIERTCNREALELNVYGAVQLQLGSIKNFATFFLV